MEPQLAESDARPSELDQQIAFLTETAHYNGDRIALLRERLRRVTVETTETTPSHIKEMVEEVRRETKLTTELREIKDKLDGNNRIIDYILSNLDL